MAVFEVRPAEVRVQAMEASVNPDLDLPPVRQLMPDARNYVRIAETVTDFSPGVQRLTGKSLDLAIEDQGTGAGRGFFAIETPQGERYTRMGNFTTNSERELVTPDGHRVLSQSGGAIRIESLRPEVARDGEIRADGKTAGTVKVVFFDNPAELEKAGHGLFAHRASAGGRRGGGGNAANVVVRQGFLEMANVNVVEQLVKLIETQRAYSAVLKSLQTIDEAASQAVRAAKNG